MSHGALEGEIKMKKGDFRDKTIENHLLTLNPRVCSPIVYNMPIKLRISVQQGPWWTSLYHLSLYQIFNTSWQPYREEWHYFLCMWRYPAEQNVMEMLLSCDYNESSLPEIENCKFCCSNT